MTHSVSIRRVICQGFVGQDKPTILELSIEGGFALADASLG